uniref:Uncharacterized protein n=1 Tax=Anguilla anguilla TaxID=7936 RepID=A0A0E9TP49_ANGAN
MKANRRSELLFPRCYLVACEKPLKPTRLYANGTVSPTGAVCTYLKP